MQSILQYRRFRKAVVAQLEHVRAKAQALQAQVSTDTRRHDPVQESLSDDKKQDLENDVEKGDFENLASRTNDDMPQEDVNATSAHQQKDEMVAEQHTEEPAEEQEADDDEDDDFMLRAIRTLSKATTQQSKDTALGHVLTGIEMRQRTAREGGEGNVFVVGYEGENDPQDPHNWSKTKRLACTLIIASFLCVGGIASSIENSALSQAAAEFGVAEVVESCVTGLFLVGYGCGGLIAGPISETVGRNPVYIVTLAIYMIWIMASGLAPNLGAQLAFRFLAGLFAATPLTCAGGSINDMWSPLERVYAFPLFANPAFAGPVFGAVMGGYIASWSWRWCDWITLIISGLALFLGLFLMPETFSPKLLQWKAENLRKITGDDRYRAAIEIRQESLYLRLKRALHRPLFLTSKEPIIILIALYLAVIYILLFTFLHGYTHVFTDTYGISQGLTGICFLGIIIGLFGSSLLVPIIYRWAKRDLAKIQEQGGDRLPPEFCLWHSMLGGSFAIPISLFWMGWTARPDISIWSPLAASVLFGYGVLCVFVTSYQYIIDAYEGFAASALASVTLIRYVAAGGMTIVGIPFYENLGVAYTLTILGCISAVLAPVPYVFYKYGPWIRSKSKYAVNVTTGGTK